MSCLNNDIKYECFNTYLDCHYSKVYNYLMHLIYDPTISEDIAQEAFLKAWQNYTSYDQRKAFFPWIVTIARNLAIDRLRKGKEVLYDPNKLLNIPILADSLNKMEKVEETLQLERALVQLTEKQRSAIYLYYYSDLSLEEVALVIKKSKRATISFLHRARQKLKTSLLNT